MLLITALVSPVSATVGKVTKELEYRNISVSLDGEKLDLRDAQGNTVEPFMFGGTNYLPARALAEALGLTVAWDGSTSTVVLTSDEYAARLESEAAAQKAAEEKAAAEKANSRTVYVTKSGEKYHYSGSCNGGTYYESTLEQALARGLKPCSKCVG